MIYDFILLAVRSMVMKLDILFHRKVGKFYGCDLILRQGVSRCDTVEFLYDMRPCMGK